MFQVKERKSYEVFYPFQVKYLVKEDIETRYRLKTGCHGKFVTLFQVEDLVKKEAETRSKLNTESHGNLVIHSNHVTTFVYELVGSMCKSCLPPPNMSW